MKNVKPGRSVPCVCLDAGHYGKYNRSSVVPEYYESDMNWKLHILLRDELEKRGIASIATRADKNTDRELTARGKASKDCDLFLSLHSNAASTPNPNWVIALYQVDDNCGDMDERSAEIGKLLAQAVANVMGVESKTSARQSSSDRDGDGYKDDYYGVLRGAHAVHTPGVILEHGFHTNEAQARWLLDEANLQKLAVVEADVIAEWFGISQETCSKETYGQEEFVRDVQAACGATVDGIAGPETLSKTVTISDVFNRKHQVVKPVQKWLKAMGYEEVGTGDGIAGPKFKSALAHFQQDNGCTPTGIAEEWGKTWQKLLGMA